ncbi:MAG: CHAT domain-containing protein [Xenococcaceae cyanobacterium MO_207.B15]|nr:CHAT domain-containing protein [Xenococcaceae cyanobacterium MO_207.B15]
MARKWSLFFNTIQPFLKVKGQIKREKRILARLFLSFIIAIFIIFSSTDFLLWSVKGAISQPGHQLLSQGKTLYQEGEYLEAVEVLEQAAVVFQEREDILAQAMTLINLSSAYQQLGRWELADNAIAKSLQLIEETEARQLLAPALDIKASLQFSRSQFQPALSSWQKAAEIYQQTDQETKAIRSKINAASAMQGLGFYRQAEETLTETNQLLQKQPDSRLKAEGLRNLGNILRITGDLNESRQILEQSLTIAQAFPNSTIVGNICLALGKTAQAQQQPETALNFYQQAETNSTSGNLKIQAQLHQQSLLIQEGKDNTALVLLPQIQAQINQLPLSRIKVYAQIVLAKNLNNIREKSDNNLPSIQDIAQILAQASQKAEKLGDKTGESSALGQLAQLYEQTQQSEIAIELTKQALVIAQASQATELVYSWQWQYGRILQQQGDSAKAIASYNEAIKTLNTLRRDLVATNPDVQFSFREEVEPIYRQLVKLLLDSDDSSQPSQTTLEQVRNTIESLRRDEIVNFLREDCLVFQQADFVDQKAAVIYTIVLDERLEVILSLPGQELRRYKTNVSSRELESLIAQLRRSLILPYTSSKQIFPLSQKLYDWLLRPIQTDLEQQEIETLVFVLDDLLQNIPMAVLHDGEQYLVEKYNLALTPGLQLFEPRPVTDIPLKAITAGLSQSRFGFSPLQYVTQELEQIEDKIPTEVLLNQEFTSNNLNQEVSSTPTSVLHIATHGQFSSQAEDTFILAWDQPINVKELDNLLRTRDISQSEALELLVLSACETASGDKRAALGIAGVAVRAGARSTLASLWLVDDKSTSKLMNYFYQELKTGISKGEALRRAQLSLLKGNYSHPRFWSAFILLGNWL